MPPDEADRQQAAALGAYLNGLRSERGLSLRDVEEKTDRKVSNAYLSQLENGKITQPSPSILEALSTVYSTPYESLMRRAGYLKGPVTSSDGRRRARTATYAIEDLNPEEERALRAYLQVLRRTPKS